LFENGCNLGSAAMPPDCGSLQAGNQRAIFGFVSWDNGHPASVTVNDDCAGPQPDVDGPLFSFSAAWQTPTTPGVTCTTTVRATSLEGLTTEIAARYHLIAPGG
jgi:hypothetical protein